MGRHRAVHRARWNRTDEGHQSAAVGDGQGEQVHIGELLRSVNARVIDPRRIENTDGARLELVHGLGCCRLQAAGDIGHGAGIGVPGVRHDPRAPVLRNSARRPAQRGVCRKPVARRQMRHMTGIE